MSDIREQIESIEKEIRETPYHKGTEHHIGKLRARRARLIDKELGLEAKKTGGGGGGGYAIKKQGDATVVLVGPPSTGKSTLINRLTNAESKVAAYTFTTVSVIPGMLKYQNAYIQILDVPGLLEGASEGKGHGKEVISVARGADLLLIMTDVERVVFLEKVKDELNKSGIRINSVPPKVTIVKKNYGGVNVVTNVKQPLAKSTIAEMACEFGLRNADITLRQSMNFEDIIDAFSGNRVYLPAIFIINKIDQEKGDTRYTDTHHDINILKISAETGTGLDKLKKTLWDKLGLIRVFLVGPDEKPNLDKPIIAKSGEDLAKVAEKLSTDILERKKLAKIWGNGAQFPGQEVPLTTPAQEGMQVRFI